jgi:hypothetical protein
MVSFLDECSKTIKKEFKQDLQTIKDNAKTIAHTYTDWVTMELRDQLNVKFEVIMGFLSSPRKLFKTETSLRPIVTHQEN